MLKQVWVKPVGKIIIARIRGVPTQDVLKECHDEIIQLVKSGNQSGLVLYDALEMEPPPVEVPLFQSKLDQASGSIRLRRAIVVPNTRLAFLARLAFCDEIHRVFYDDLVAAMTWLTDEQTV